MERRTCSVVLRWLVLGPFIKRLICQFQLFTLVHHTSHANETLLDWLKSFLEICINEAWLFFKEASNPLSTDGTNLLSLCVADQSMPTLLLQLMIPFSLSTQSCINKRFH